MQRNRPSRFAEREVGWALTMKYKFTRLGFDQWSSEARPRSRNTANERVVSASKHGKYEGFFFNIKLCSMKKICKLTLSVINIFPSLRYS